MIFLYVIVAFFGSTGRDPWTAVARAPSMEACKAEAAKLTAVAEKDQTVQGYSIKCVTVPTKT